ncbi:hypothetical protein MACK_002348 [Theileria orientalis]|uniref:4-methyl-5(B-hydroxyethyl)-thiazol monophosphate biosynthesis enzyme n=1 Tax=Theileria orientalis TaxID=68886 RepID=A0A976MBZ5_THEOR|nr:hypothetical protein MACK_002348 [Theileria orientalis]
MVTKARGFFVPNLMAVYNKCYESGNEKLNEPSGTTTFVRILRLQERSDSFFKRYEHKPQGHLETGLVYIYKDYDKGQGRKATYSNLGTYSDALLEKAHVYFSIFDDKHNNPLILVLFFRGRSNPKTRYYRRSVFDGEIARNGNNYVGKLDLYEGEQKLLDVLVKESDIVPDILNYEIDTIKLGKYNKKINVTKGEIKGPSDQSHGFNKYTHEPLGSGGENKAFVMYKQQVLTFWNSSRHPGRAEQILDLQATIIHNMDVYYSDKIKEPLMIYLLKGDSSRPEHVYYFRKVHNGLYWEKMDSKSYNQLLGLHLGGIDVHTKLNDQGCKILLEALRKLEHNLTKILVIIVDKIIEYSNSDVTRIFQGSYYDTERFRFVNDLGKIPVKISSESKNLEDIGYKIYEHDITPISKLLQTGESLRLTFIRSEVESIGQDSDFLTIDLDYQREYGTYHTQSRDILVSNAYSLEHNYKWYKH